jgi:Bacterial PH domain
MWQRILHIWKNLWGDGNELPSSVTDYLLPYEKMVIAVHKHPGAYIGHAVLLACSCAAASVLTVRANSSILVLCAVWGTCGILLFLLVMRAIAWFYTFFVATETRLIFISRLVARKLTMVPLREIRDLKLHRSLLGQLVGYGKFIPEPSKCGYGFPKMNYLPYPEQLFLEVCGLIFPDSVEDSHEHEHEHEQLP